MYIVHAVAKDIFQYCNRQRFLYTIWQIPQNLVRQYNLKYTCRIIN